MKKRIISFLLATIFVLTGGVTTTVKTEAMIDLYLKTAKATVDMSEGSKAVDTLIPLTDEYEVNVKSWYDITAEKTIEIGDAFEIGHIYTLTVEFVLLSSDYWGFAVDGYSQDPSPGGFYINDVKVDDYTHNTVSKSDICKVNLLCTAPDKPFYDISVEGGNASREKAQASTPVKVMVADMPHGYKLKKWISDDVVIDNPTATIASFVMPEHAVNIATEIELAEETQIIEAISVKGLNTPVIGKSPSLEGITIEGEGFLICLDNNEVFDTYTSWYFGRTQLTEEDTFQKYKIYKACFCLQPEENYIFADDLKVYTSDGEVEILQDKKTGQLLLTIRFPAKMGDVNRDLVVNAEDALMILKAVAKLENLYVTGIDYADVDENGEIDADDALMILRIAARLE